MKKTLFAMTFAAAGLMLASAASAQSHSDKGGWFVNGNIGESSMNKGYYDGHDTGYALNGGYRWSLGPSAALGFELGYNDLGNIKISNAFTGDPVVARNRSRLRGWTAGATGHFNVTPAWYVSARTGVYGWRGHGLSNDEIPLRKSLSTTDWYGGVGVGYDFPANWSLGVNYDYFRARKSGVDLSSDMISLAAEYRF